LHRCWHSESLICGPPEKPLAANVLVYAPDHGPFASSREQLTYQPVCMLRHSKINRNDLSGSWLLRVLEFRSLSQFVYEKLEKQSLWPFVGRPRKLLIRTSSSNSEILGLLCHVIVVNVEHHMLSQLSLSRNLWSCEPILL
jgi:hypothetical protein